MSRRTQAWYVYGRPDASAAWGTVGLALDDRAVAEELADLFIERHPRRGQVRIFPVPDSMLPAAAAELTFQEHAIFGAFEAQMAADMRGRRA